MAIDYHDGRCTVARELPAELQADINILAELLPEWETSGCKIRQPSLEGNGIYLYLYTFESKDELPTKAEIETANTMLDKALHWMWEISRALRMVKMILPPLLEALAVELHEINQFGCETLLRVAVLESQESPTWSNFAEHTLEIGQLRQEVISLKKTADTFRQAYNELERSLFQRAEDKPPIPGEQYKLSLEELGLSRRTMLCLRRAGITTVGELVTKDVEYLMSVRDFGEKSRQETEECLSALGLFLTPPYVRAAQ